MGSTGSGKTQITSLILQQFQDRGIRLIIHEMKGDFYKRFGRDNDLIFCPVDQRHMRKYGGWSLKNSIKNPQDINTIVSLLIPTNPRASDPYWYIAPRDLSCGILKYCYYENKISNADIWKTCSLPLAELAPRLKDVPGAEAAYSHISNTQGNAANDVKAVMMSYMGAFEYLQYTDGNFIIDDWSKEGNESIYLLNFTSISACVKPVMTLFVSLLMNSMLSLTGDLHRRIALILDEFPQLHKIDILPNFLALSRDRGAVNILGWQSHSLIQQIYGDETPITSSLRTKIYCQIEDEKTAEQIEKKYGHEDVIQYLRSHQLTGNSEHKGTTFSQNVIKRAVIPQHELQYLKTTDKYYEFYLCVPSFYPTKLKNPIIRYPEMTTELIQREEISLSYMLTAMKDAEEKKEAIIKHANEMKLKKDELQGIEHD